MWLVQQLLGFLLIKLRRQTKNILAVLSKYTVGLNTLSYFNYKQKIWEDVLMVLKKCKKFAEKASIYIYIFFFTAPFYFSLYLVLAVNLTIFK